MQKYAYIQIVGLFVLYTSNILIKPEKILSVTYSFFKVFCCTNGVILSYKKTIVCLVFKFKNVVCVELKNSILRLLFC